MIEAVKMVEGTDDMIHGPGMPFGGPFKVPGKPGGQDIMGEHFTKHTDFALDWYSERPFLWHHGLDPDAGITVAGRVKSWEIKGDIGVWTKVQLDKSNEYFEAIKDLVSKKKVFFSSGAMAHLVQVDAKTGEIKRWPWVELSGTPSPANPTATVDFATAAKRYEMAGLKAVWDEKESSLRAVLDAEARNALDDSDFAYIDSQGGRHLPINDAAHTRAAMSRFNQTAFESDAAKATARKKILAACEKFGIEVSDDSMMMKAAPTFSEIASLFLDDNAGIDYEPVPITSHAETIAIMAASLLERTKGLQGRRLKEGRVISDANRKRLMGCMEQMSATMAEMQNLLDSTAPQPAKAAAVRRLRAQLVAQQIGAMTLN